MLSNEALERCMAQVIQDVQVLQGALNGLNDLRELALGERVAMLEEDVHLLGTALSVLIAGMRDTGLMSRRQGMPQVMVLPGQQSFWPE